MNTYRNNKFLSGKIQIDNGSYKDCLFSNCTIIYGGGPVELTGNIIDGCRFEFTGAAAATLQFLQEIRRSSPTSIDPILDAIKAGTFGSAGNNNGQG
jgi:hypothetical protein